VHPVGRRCRETLAEDREAVLLAEKLGFEEAFIGEHISDLAETITNCLIFIATLARETSRIRLGSGTVNLANRHPAATAAEIAMVDTLLEGRFILGIGPGGLRSDAEITETLDVDRNALFVEAIEHMIALWTREPPYQLHGTKWNITTERTWMPDLGQGGMLKPFQRPHPPIVVTAILPDSNGIAAAAQRGWTPISANFVHPWVVKTHWPKYLEGCARAGREARGEDWRVAKSIFVADDEKTAKEYATGPRSPYRYYYNQLLTKLVRNGRTELFKTRRDQPDSEVTLDSVCDQLVIYGTPDQVAEKILAFREQVGDFGTLLYAGKDWADSELGRRSMILMAEKVMPKVNAAIG
jgi:alkanesulfonate monooxygenase SsuD/methylene tetrahydromethanopterin reductase-like flavin-dependent oxidoreductase (luciferase family)